VKIEEDLLRFCHQNKNITSIVKTMGEWDLEIDVDNKDFHEFKHLCAGIRSKFGGNIHCLETIPVFSNIKTSYLPTSFFLDPF
jgi:hypothetical protein